MRRLHQPAPEDVENPFVFGQELILDIDGCNPAVIRDADELRRYGDELVKLLGMQKFGDPLIAHFGHASEVTSGYTYIQLIETSSISIHMSEGLARAHINIFSCRPFDTHEALEYTENFLGGTDTTYTILAR